MSFLRHADLSPDGHFTPMQGKAETTAKLSPPLVTHRYDESGPSIPGELLSSRARFCFLDKVQYVRNSGLFSRSFGMMKKSN